MLIQQKSWYWLSEKRWNNSFAYKDWKKIWIPPVKIWKPEDLKLWDKIVFSDFEDWELKESIWLESHLWILDDLKVPVFVCDNHNRVMEAWHYFNRSKLEGLGGKGEISPPLLIHIDQHRDEAAYLDVEDWEKDLRICDYINWAKDNGWIQKKHISLCESRDFFDFTNFTELNYILNIDLDIFAPEQTIVPHKEIWDLIFKLEKNASLVTIATSPLFLDQKKAIELLNHFFQARNI